MSSMTKNKPYATWSQTYKLITRTSDQCHYVVLDERLQWHQHSMLFMPSGISNNSVLKLVNGTITPVWCQCIPDASHCIPDGSRCTSNSYNASTLQITNTTMNLMQHIRLKLMSTEAMAVFFFALCLSTTQNDKLLNAMLTIVSSLVKCKDRHHTTQNLSCGHRALWDAITTLKLIGNMPYPNSA